MTTINILIIISSLKGKIKMLTSQVLRTYEGRRLHEKLQHVAKLNMELVAAPQIDAEEGRSSWS